MQVILNQQATDITEGLQQVKFYLDNDLIQTRGRFLIYPLSVTTKNLKMIFKQKSKQFELFENANRRCVQHVTEKNCNYLQRKLFNNSIVDLEKRKEKIDLTIFFAEGFRAHVQLLSRLTYEHCVLTILLIILTAPIKLGSTT